MIKKEIILLTTCQMNPNLLILVIYLSLTIYMLEQPFGYTPLNLVSHIVLK